MIAQVTKAQHRQLYWAACAGKPYFGCILPLHLQLFGKTGSLLAGPGLAIDANGSGAIAAGEADPEELASFLQFIGKHRLLTDGTAPAGWRPGRTLHLFVLEAGGALPTPPLPPLLPTLTLNDQPSPGQVADLLFAQRGERRDGFYSELCTKRNHGKARVWALEQNGAIACTAGAYALHDGQAYLACIETVPALRGQQLGGWLTAHAANALAADGWRVLLLCEDRLCVFYTRLGFAHGGTLCEYTDL